MDECRFDCCLNNAKGVAGVYQRPRPQSKGCRNQSPESSGQTVGRFDSVDLISVLAEAVGSDVEVVADVAVDVAVVGGAVVSSVLAEVPFVVVVDV